MTSRWAVLALLCLARMSMGLHLQAVAAIAPFLITDLGFSYAEVGLLIGLFMLPGAFLALPGALVSGRLGDKATLLVGLALLTLGAGLLAVSPGLAPAVVARLVSGAGGTLLAMQVAKIVTDLFVGKEIATAMGITLGTFPLGIALAMATLSGLAAAASWQVAVAATAATTVLILMLVTTLYRDPPRRGQVGHVECPPLWTITPRELCAVLLAGLAFAVVNAAWIVYVSFTPTLLIERGWSEAQAGALASWAPWVMIGSVSVAGYLLDRTGRATAWLVLAAVVTATICVALPLWEPAWLWIVLFGIASAPIVVGVMALPGDALRADSRRTGFGVFFTMNYFGFGLLPPLAGYLLDLTRSTAAPSWFSGLLWLSIVPALLVFRWLQRRHLRLRQGVPLAEGAGRA